ncbi:uncharacterized protein LOC108707110 isoform X1 [Xenopus laevis]|uniref:Uncharacterized protein LOC108707110 isoform X1 n=1 Tax=Xenopus laevis TaxID=8355 RepID=A0A8J0U1X2_XENLA|nr:uncharacterized protein LOC108707110 isoform X1 [Xenopus laevis]
MMSEQVMDTNSIPTAKNKDSPPSERDCTFNFAVKCIEESPEIHLQTSNDKAVAESQNDLRSLDLSHMPCTGTQIPVKVCEGYEDYLNRDMTSDEITEYTNRHNPKNQISPHPSVSDKIDYESTMHCDQQIDLSEFKETRLKSVLLEQVPCQTVDSNKAFVQNHLPSTPTKGDYKSAQVNALIPYKNLFLDYTSVPSKQCKIGSRELESNLEIIQNVMKKIDLLNKKAYFIAAGENGLQIFGDVFELKACGTKVVGNFPMNLENSIKNADCCQGLTMRPSIHLHINEFPVVCFDNLANLVFKSSNIPLQIHFFDVLTTGKRIYLSESSKNAAFSLDEIRLELSKHQYALSITKGSQLHNTSIGAVVYKIESDGHCMQQSNRSSIHEKLGRTLFSVSVNKPLSANIAKNNEVISDFLFINVTPDCVIPQCCSAICCGFICSENADEMIYTEVRTLHNSGANNCTPFGTEVHLQNHITPKVSMRNELSVLRAPAIQHATRKRKGSTII